MSGFLMGGFASFLACFLNVVFLFLFGSTCQYRLTSAANMGWRFVSDAILPGHRRAPQWVPARTLPVHWSPRIAGRLWVARLDQTADTRQIVFFLCFCFFFKKKIIIFFVKIHTCCRQRHDSARCPCEHIVEISPTILIKCSICSYHH